MKTTKAVDMSALSLEKYSPYVQAKARLVELQLDLQSKHSRKEDLLADMNAPRTARVSNIMARAAAMISGSTARLPAFDAERVRRDYTAVLDEIAVVTQAIDLQKRVLQDLRAEFSQEICEHAAPYHRELVRSVVEAVQALSVASTAEQAFRDALRDNDVFTGPLYPMPFVGIGDMNAPRSQGRAALYLREAFAYGFIEKHELPKRVQESLPSAAVPTPPARVKAAAPPSRPLREPSQTAEETAVATLARINAAMRASRAGDPTRARELLAAGGGSAEPRDDKWTSGNG